MTAPDTIDLSGELTLEAAGEGPRKMKIVAYNGGVLKSRQFPLPVVVDIGGIERTDRARPVLANHDNTLEAAVGHTTNVDFQSGRIVADGVFSGANAAADQIVSKLDGGMPLQASIGMRIPGSALKQVNRGQTVRVNGQEFQGPLLVATKSRMNEITITPLGLDETTSVSLAASLYYEENPPMADKADKTPEQPAEVELQATQPSVAQNQPAEPEFDLAASRDARAAEADRCDTIELLCSKYGNPTIEVDGAEVSLKAHAIRNGYTTDKVELLALRTSAPKAPAVQVSRPETDEKVLEASIARSVLSPEVWEKSYDDKTLEATDRREYRNYSLGHLLHDCILKAGAYVRPGAHGDELVDAYREHVLAASGFSTTGVSTFLENVGHKAVAAAYEKVDTTFDRLSSRASHSDFKQHKRYRLTSGLKFEAVGKDGELKHGKLHEESYTNELETYGGFLQLTRQDIINDDLNLFNTIPTQIGRQAAIAVDKAVYSAFVGSGSSFFKAANSNVKTSNAFTADGAGLDAAEQVFKEMKDAAGDYILSRPSNLVVPHALFGSAQRLMRSASLDRGGVTSEAGDVNIYAGRYGVVTSPWLSDSSITGNSATTWYLFGDPGDVPAIEVAYLNGADRPTLKSEDAPMEVLGVRWAYFFDYGVALQDFRGAVRCTA